MAIDTPATIAILGAGPIGLEAALYARFMGYDVLLLERGEIAQHLLDWGAAPLPAAFGQYRSTLGLAAIDAQGEPWQAPRDDEILTGLELRQRYYLPLAATDLLIDSIHVGKQVLSVAYRPGSKHDRDDEAPSGSCFQLLTRDFQTGNEAQHAADAVLDCTGAGGNVRLEPVGISAEAESVGERGFYRLGARSAVGDRAMAAATGLDQIRQLFAVLCDRPQLDLYARMKTRQ